MVFSEKMSLLGENQAEPKAIETAVRREVESARQATGPGSPAVVTSTDHAERPTICTRRINL